VGICLEDDQTVRLRSSGDQLRIVRNRARRPKLKIPSALARIEDEEKARAFLRRGLAESDRVVDVPL